MNQSIFWPFIAASVVGAAIGGVGFYLTDPVQQVTVPLKRSDPMEIYYCVAETCRVPGGVLSPPVEVIAGQIYICTNPICNVDDGWQKLPGVIVEGE